jgi:hypothetical protein
MNDSKIDIIEETLKLTHPIHLLLPHQSIMGEAFLANQCILALCTASWCAVAFLA